MNYINSTYIKIYEIKKSKFIAHIVPYSQFSSIMKELKEKHPKARHFVYAYRYLNDYEQIVENSSDDGEPKGTSGKPALAVLSGAKIINSAVIIVRYFGGVKLGTGGLVKAYSNSTNLVLNDKETKLIQYEKLKTYFINTEYSKLSFVEYILNKERVNIIKKEFNSEVEIEFEASELSYKNIIVHITSI